MCYECIPVYTIKDDDWLSRVEQQKYTLVDPGLEYYHTLSIQMRNE